MGRAEQVKRCVGEFLGVDWVAGKTSESILISRTIQQTGAAATGE